MCPVPFQQVSTLSAAMSLSVQQHRPEEVVQRARAAFRLGKTRKLQFREGQLRALLRLLDENQHLLLDAVFADLRKPVMETTLCELDPVRNEIRRALHKVWDWSKPDAPGKNILNLLDTVHVRKDPYGVVLIVSAWNCPLLLLLRPFVGALAAGNCVILKPSDKAHSTAMVITDLVGRYLDSECYQVVNGGAAETSALLRQRFDYVFYTGGDRVGRMVRDAANRHLTPVTLELGGKCPTFVDDNVNLHVAAKRIAWGKLINAGQTCLAPDHLLCSKSIEGRLVAALQLAITALLGTEPRRSSFYARIINDAHYERLVHMTVGAKIALGGDCDPYERYIEPTVLINVTRDHPLMHDEIFGPLLPIVRVEGCDEAMGLINAMEKPLAIYVFSNSKNTIDKFLCGTSSGGVVINDVVEHSGANNVPFGGVGHSGMGCYGGKYTFDTFTHHKTCLVRDLGMINEKLASVRYPPYPPGNIRLLRLLNTPRNYPPIGWMKNYLIFCLGVAVAAAYYYYSK